MRVEAREQRVEQSRAQLLGSLGEGSPRHACMAGRMLVRIYGAFLNLYCGFFWGVGWGGEWVLETGSPCNLDCPGTRSVDQAVLRSTSGVLVLKVCATTT
jgi:hypothetical protein